MMHSSPLRVLLAAALILTGASVACTEDDVTSQTPDDQNDDDQNDAGAAPNVRSAAAVKADVAFWQLMHDESQDYATVITELESAAEQDPSDVYTKAHLGWVHFLAFQEGTQRGLVAPAEVPSHLGAALGLFTETAAMAPEAARIREFLGATRRTIASQSGDDALFAQGMADVEASIEMWPQFALFGAFYTLDALTPVDSPLFQRAIDTYWAWQDVCAHETVDRSNPDWSPYLDLETQEGPDRACWNSWIAPYGREGAALIIGDALLKVGEVNAAEVMYGNAKLSSSYDTWPHKALLEYRLENMEENAIGFQAPVSFMVPNDPRTTLVAGTRNACSVCHGGDANQLYSAPAWVGETAHLYAASPR